ncbi:Rne/Rng family ribonuclease [Novosphingobium sp. Gsoil 351]|uniref:Rne/Rng family ribonuclease n=1 Tax=Novosphingobium sp. Gsoil 351 TaxID=2675225 RepID=UPI0012B4C799|nr:Rne/Rng family ribonuclease [Novosphingobium sp. Gsoil 351]QGN53943.1 Rne/Rng family ribonuclease [Novosphingobium sp. Gsoil 351]
MTTRMLIDARHPEETRVAVLKGNRIEEFDFESADHKQIKGNIYLAKVTRVEPSLQAAFVDFGGNRHGFLAFSEIHPDYYQIPKQDREALLAEEAAHAEEEAALRAADEADDDDYEGGENEDGESADGFVDELAGDDGVEEVDTSDKDDVATIEGGEVSDDETGQANDEQGAEGERGEEAGEDDRGDRAEDDRGGRQRRGRRQGGRAQAKAADDLRDKRMALRRRYKIQDVIQRRQVLLVQVVKEERGNKGAALTTYLSLAGRYCVLMPNSSHGGGISRKISSAADRKRLKSIISEMNLPKSMGCIVRTAGLSRTKPEIKRDFDYLARLWDEIRENTLKSSAPALIHSDSDLIKRAIRDIYNKEIEEVVVEGEGGYRSAKEFMKLLMPSHAKRVKQYADPVPLFQRYGAEDQLTAMYDPVVQLKSGGYLVINPTEALVSIDINSGRSTKEHGIEATALKTNMEAAAEIARQLRLRDMAGLVVIDFIDMEYGANVRKVEKCMKDALRNDRARIQIGRISGFGLMEMSRQRLRTGVLEATTRSCPHCDGSGLVRTASSAGLSALRMIEDEAAKGKGSVISLFASQEAAIYLLNAKRHDLGAIEDLYGVRVEVLPEGEDEGAKMRVASSGPRPTHVPTFAPIAEPEPDDLDDEEIETAEDEEEDDRDERGEDGERSERGDRDRNKRRRRRGGRNRERGDEPREERARSPEAADDSADGESSEAAAPAEGEDDGSEGPRKRRRRSRRRRGGRGRGEGFEGGEEGEARVDGEAVEGQAVAEVAEQLGEDIAVVADPEAEPAKPKRRSRVRKADAETLEAPVETAEAPVEAVQDEAPAKPVRRSRRKAEPVAELAAEPPVEVEAEAVEAAPVKKPRARKAAAKADTAPETATQEEAGPAAPAAANEDAPGDEPAAKPRSGWWQRTFG